MPALSSWRCLGEIPRVEWFGAKIDYAAIGVYRVEVNATSGVTFSSYEHLQQKRGTSFSSPDSNPPGQGPLVLSGK